MLLFSAVPVLSVGQWTWLLLGAASCGVLLFTLLRAFLTRGTKRNVDILQLAREAGFDYDEESDIFFTIHDSWQRAFGYQRLYDEAAAPLSMIIDCEPVYFVYDGKQYLLEMWKGQYGMAAGAEVGLYTADIPSVVPPEVLHYQAVADTDMLSAAFVLYHHEQPVLRRSDRHWWLTGFRLGLFAEPEDLSLSLRIAFPARAMAEAFFHALQALGYTRENAWLKGTAVFVQYRKPFSPQPVTRTTMTDKLTQEKNRALCDIYRDLTGNRRAPEALELLRREHPAAFRKLLNSTHNPARYAAGRR